MAQKRNHRKVGGSFWKIYPKDQQKTKKSKGFPCQLGFLQGQIPGAWRHKLRGGGWKYRLISRFALSSPLETCLKEPHWPTGRLPFLSSLRWWPKLLSKFRIRTWHSRSSVMPCLGDQTGGVGGIWWLNSMCGFFPLRFLVVREEDNAINQCQCLLQNLEIQKEENVQWVLIN